MKNIFDSRLLTGFQSLDEIFGGFCYSNLVTLAGRPCMRTEYFTYAMMRNWIQNDMVEDGFVFFSMRSNTNGLTKQLIELNNALVPTATKYIEELHSITLSALCNKIRKYALQERVRVFIIDNFNSIVADGVHNSRSERQFISWSLLQLARELDIPMSEITKFGGESKIIYERTK